MSVEEYSLKLSKMSKYAPSLLLNPSNEISRFVIGVSDLVREEWCTAMLHDHMVVARLMLYEKSIEECKLKRIVRNFERGGSSDLEKTRVKKSAQTQEEPRIAKEKFDKGVGSQNEKPTCASCGKRHYGEYILGKGSCL